MPVASSVAVKDSMAKPGQYLILEFDFSRAARPRKIEKSAESLGTEINRRLSRFKLNILANHLRRKPQILLRMTQLQISQPLSRLLIVRFRY